MKRYKNPIPSQFWQPYVHIIGRQSHYAVSRHSGNDVQRNGFSPDLEKVRHICNKLNLIELEKGSMIKGIDGSFAMVSNKENDVGFYIHFNNGKRPFRKLGLSESFALASKNLGISEDVWKRYFLDESIAKVIPAENAPKGWMWREWDDGDGGLYKGELLSSEGEIKARYNAFDSSYEGGVDKNKIVDDILANSTEDLSKISFWKPLSSGFGDDKQYIANRILETATNSVAESEGDFSSNPKDVEKLCDELNSKLLRDFYSSKNIEVSNNFMLLNDERARDLYLQDTRVYLLNLDGSEKMITGESEIKTHLARGVALGVKFDDWESNINTKIKYWYESYEEYELAEEYGYEDLIESVSTPAKHLPVGWHWRDWADGSGGLYSPSGESVFSYDEATREYKWSDGNWYYYGDEGYSCEEIEKMHATGLLQKQNKKEIAIESKFEPIGLQELIKKLHPDSNENKGDFLLSKKSNVDITRGSDDMGNRYSKEQYEAANRQSMARYLQSIGHSLKKEGAAWYKSETYKTLVIDDNKNWFYWNDRDIKSSKPVELAKLMNMEQGYGEKEALIKAVTDLAALGGVYADSAYTKDYTPKQHTSQQSKNSLSTDSATKTVEQYYEDKKPLIPPERAKGNVKAIEYLKNVRGIHPAVISHCIDNGTVYQQAGYHANVIFVSKDNDGNIGHIHQRGREAYIDKETGERKTFRLDVAGSQKKFPFVVGGGDKADTVYVFEATIDAMSHASLHVLNGNGVRSITEVHRISMHGPATSALDTFLENNPQVTIIVPCTDADEAGIRLAQKIKEKYTEKGYDVLDHIKPTVGKDFNDMLLKCDKYGINAPQHQELHQSVSSQSQATQMTAQTVTLEA